MTDDIHEEAADEEAGRAFRPGRRPAWIAIALNGLLLLGALGVPYVRGRMRAEDAGAHFARFAACTYGGRPADDPGLALPAGDREHFAARVERAEPGWPAGCVEILHAMRPEPAIFLFPSPKQAEEDLRRALDVTEGELVALGRARSEGAIGAVPERPLRAIGALRSALANLMQASDVALDPQQPALAWDEDATIVAPSRIPLLTAAAGTTVVRVEPAGLRAMSSDGRTISEVSVADGSVQQVHVRRPTSARGVALGPGGGLVLWITSESTCATDAARCASRLLGIGTIHEGEREPSPRWWVAAHPAGRIDRAVRFGAGSVDVIAVAEGGSELRSFALSDDAPEPIEDAPVTPIAARATTPLGAPLDAIALGDGRAIRVDREEGHLVLRGDALADAGVAIDPPGGEAPRSGQVALARCAGFTTIATPAGIAVVAGDRVAEVIAERLREPVLGASPSDDATRLVCTDRGADVIAIDRQRRAVRWACTAEGCADAQVVARDVSRIDAAHAAGTTVVAWTGDTTHPQVRVARVRGDVIGGAEVPAPCWDDQQGLCGAPIVVAEGDRLMVAAREETDLLVLELAETGFRRLPGL